MRSFITQFIGDDGKVIMVERPQAGIAPVDGRMGTPVCPTVDDLKNELINSAAF